MVSNVSKTLLRNIIRHTDTHNRIVEESDMWRSHRARNCPEKSGKRKRARERSPDHIPHHSVSSSCHQVPRAHMDRESSPDVSTFTHSLTCKKRIQDAEEKNPDRWGHAGYKQLYPEQFLTDSDRSTSSDEGTSKSKSHRKKAKKDHKSKKHMKKEKHKKRKHKHKSKHSSEGSHYEWVPKSDR